MGKGMKFLLLAACCMTSLSGYAQKPNIILIMADDHANRTISAYGAGINNTPNIDRIANEGAIFLNSYCANSICQSCAVFLLIKQ